MSHDEQSQKKVNILLAETSSSAKLWYLQCVCAQTFIQMLFAIREERVHRSCLSCRRWDALFSLLLLPKVLSAQSTGYTEIADTSLSFQERKTRFSNYSPLQDVPVTVK